jgi:hypothetical protein
MGVVALPLRRMRGKSSNCVRCLVHRTHEAIDLVGLFDSFHWLYWLYSCGLSVSRRAKLANLHIVPSKCRSYAHLARCRTATPATEEACFRHRSPSDTLFNQRDA